MFWLFPLLLDFYHWLGFLFRPEITALAMILSDISVVGNSLLLRNINYKLEIIKK